MLASELLATLFVVLGLSATSVLAQAQAGRDAYTRGSVSFGCWSVRPTAQDQTSPYYQTGNAASTQACSDNCAVRRPQDASAPLFWYWQGTSQQCWCSNWYQRPQQQQSGNSPCYTGSGDTRGLWAYGRISTSFTTFGAQCRSRAQVTLDNSAFTAAGSAQVGPAGCQRQCRSNRFAYWWSDNSSNNAFRCACSNTVATSQTASTTCAAGTVFVWEHSVLAQASALDRRKRRAAPENEKEFLLCPKGKTACAIRGSDGQHIDHGFELTIKCIDTQSELESCGGCIDGHMLYNGTIVHAYDGVNCGSSGAALGHASCINGECEIGACRPGFSLIGKLCIPDGLYGMA